MACPDPRVVIKKFLSHGLESQRGALISPRHNRLLSGPTRPTSASYRVEHNPIAPTIPFPQSSAPILPAAPASTRSTSKYIPLQQHTAAAVVATIATLFRSVPSAVVFDRTDLFPVQFRRTSADNMLVTCHRPGRSHITFVPCSLQAHHAIKLVSPPSSSATSPSSSKSPAVSNPPSFQHSSVPSLAAHPNPPLHPSSAASLSHCCLLWFRVGHLRLADNPAVSSASLSGRPVLPVVTLCPDQLTHSVLTAIADLRIMLTESLSSTLIVRVVDRPGLESQIDALCDLARIVRPHGLFANDIDLHMLQRQQRRRINLTSMTSISLFHSLTYSSLPPLSLPPPPQCAQRIISDSLNFPPSNYHSLSHGETHARISLQRLLSTPTPFRSKHEIFLRMRHELYAGSISKHRIILEWNKLHHQQVTTKPFKRWRSPFSAPNPSSSLSVFQPFFMGAHTTPAIVALSISAYDVNGGDRRGVEWDEGTKSFVLQEWEHTETERRMNPKERVHEFMRRRRQFLTRAFLPEDVTPDYYSFTAWRFAQRCVSATIGVFGTSSLLVALGIRSGRIGQAAVISWVLKDGLGRVGKMIWAGSMGKDFDVDPKRWRFRSALLYAFGNGLEIVTQIFPASFLIFATAANSMKQVSMLTSSATRNAMYRSFGERSQNIANITAKGEAQIVVADLIGMACGIRLSKLVGSSRANVLGAYSILTLLDIFGIYMELRSVVFRTLNAERSSIIINRVLHDGVFLSPSQVSPRESIFLKPKHQSWVRLSSIAKAGQSPQELDMLLKVFRRERFMVSTPGGKSTGPCRLVLRKDATNEDVLRAMLLVGHVQRELRNRASKNEPLSMEETERLLRSARSLTKRSFPWFVQGLKANGWNLDNLLFSTMKRRGYWRS